ncbi:acyltransferase family protein [Lampropedia aestuarii]|uniref:acyltransferase family protein n=1 Tax=Lampropedia aestuarii TaxID=2562762 RepID=UPI002468B27A|nr:acyltransferase [Lampropedia aestuarii]MDH5856416.1 acyltransferase [Lampropedia aestuarii]
MHSSSGHHFARLDHVRALAALLVIAWHFMHGANGSPVPFGIAPSVFPLAIFSEGHTGVALFMSLSGYLFARLLEGRSVHYGRFLFNRALRLLPLLLLVFLIVGVMHALKGHSLPDYLNSLQQGFWKPSWPNGGWSIAVELHFYLLLPVLLWLCAKSPWWLVAILVLALSVRALLWQTQGEVQFLAYFTILGRIDQFLLGMLACHWRRHLSDRHAIALSIAIAFSLLYWWFAHSGGFYLRPSFPSPARLWIVLPLLEGLTFACLIAWYDTSFHATAKPGKFSSAIDKLSRWVAKAGAYSYSVYLLHFFVVFAAAEFIDTHIMHIHNFYWALLWSFVFYGLMLIPAHLSYRWIEVPFLKYRKPYLKQASISLTGGRA